MYSKLIKNDIIRSKLITVTITAFILVSAMLTSLAAALAVNLSGAIDNLLIEAKSLHFMQMHTGNVDMEELQDFAETHNSVEEYQVLEFLNLDAMDIIIEDDSLAGSLQDNGLSMQGEKFDFLLNLNGEVIHPDDGEIYVPIYYMKESDVRIGDPITIHGVSFTVAGFLRDSTMNPALISSKRFLVSPADFEKVRMFGSLEYLIEFRLQENVSISDFETDYLSADLPANGPPPLTFTQVKMINGITDGIMIAILALIVILVTIVAFLCIRFTLMAKIEEDFKEIGVLKVVGLRISQIKKLYLAKYGVIAGVACVLGFLASVPLQEPFMQNIRLYMGESNAKIPALLCGLAGAAVIYGVVVIYVNVILRRFRKISAAQAVRLGASVEKSASSRIFKFSHNRLFSRNIFLGIKDVISRKKLYVTMLMVLIISSFIMIVPQNIYNTISSKTFITYLGSGICDMNIGVTRTLTDDVQGKAAEIADMLAADENVEKYASYTNMMFEMKAADGTIQRMRVSMGDHSAFPLSYSKGKAPESESEIAISTLNADDLEKTIGDNITLIVGGEEKHLTVCGIYSDVTNGGRTAKAALNAADGEVLGIGFEVLFRDGSDAKALITQYRSALSFAKITGIEENIEQMLGPMLSAIQKSSFAAIAATVLLTLLVTLLFMKMLVVKDRYSIAIMKSIGFTGRDIRRQYMTRSVIVLALGVVIGTILANTLGEYVGVAVVSSFGAATFNFVVNPWFAYILSPLLIAACVMITTLLGIADIGTLKISEYIKEI